MLRRQIGYLRYEPLHVAARCHQGYPAVVEGFHPPGDPKEGEVLSTSLDWITCPWLEKAIQRVENEGWLHHLRWILADPRGAALKKDLLAASDAYTSRLRERMDARSPGTFARRFEGRILGIGGTADPAALKCLHNHAATALSGEATPIGAFALALVEMNLGRHGQGPLDCGADCMEEPEKFGLEV